MDDLKLSDTEQRYFSDLFVCCDNENTGKVTYFKARELFQSSNIPSEALSKIIDIVLPNSCSSSDLISRKQFFAILKLIAAYQANIPLRRDILTVSLELPLPRFTWPSSQLENDVSTNAFNSTRMSSIENHHLDPSSVGMYTKNDFTSTDSEVESQTEINNGDNSIIRLRNSPDASSTASDSPTPTNSIQERTWGVPGRWQGPPCEEQRQLLATEEESSDNEVSSEVWTINSEQKEYYTKQFLLLQPDLDSIIPGHVARPFFEKSRLPVSELRRIWQLADVTRDGALNRYEFSIAMHLVVLRRNNIPLPDVLPESLAALAHMSLLFSEVSQTSSSPTSAAVTTATATLQHQTSISPQLEQRQQTKDVGTREWTKFVDSPTSSISSPGPKPVNFDFHKSAVETDPKILHPVPLRVTPEISPALNNEDDLASQIRRSPRTAESGAATLTTISNSEMIRPIQRPQAKIKNTIPGPGALPPPPDAGPMSLPLGPPRKEAPPPPPPRPPMRTHTRSSSLDLNRLGRSLPPAVPPRASPSPGSPVKRLINQKSEGDITPMNSQTIGGGAGVGNRDGTFANFDNFTTGSNEIQQETYENVLQSTGIFPGEQLEAERRRLFAQFTKVNSSIETGDCGTNETNPRKHGAFEVYRKPTTSDTVNSMGQTTTTNPSSLSLGVNKKEMFRRLQEQNATLLRICQELSQELADVKEERIALTIRLEQQTQSGSG